MSRFIPKGFIDTPRALIRLAGAAHPDRWNFQHMRPKERAIWEGLGLVLNSELIEGHLRVLVPPNARDGTVDRLSDYGDALDDLRASLYARELVAYFIDENGSMDFIRAEGWGADAGYEILLKGSAWLEGHSNAVCMLVFFKSADIDSLAGKIAKAADSTDDPARPKIAPAKIQKAFDDWRASQPKIPTYREDVAYMRLKHGVGRDKVRVLRASAETNTIGRPKASS